MGEPRTRHSRLGVASLVLEKGEEASPSTYWQQYWCSPAHHSPFPQGHIAGSCSTWHPPGPSVLFRQAAFQLSGAQCVLMHVVVPPQVRDFAVLIVDLHEIPDSLFL